jgi:hypothetical protein
VIRLKKPKPVKKPLPKIYEDELGDNIEKPKIHSRFKCDVCGEILDRDDKVICDDCYSKISNTVTINYYAEKERKNQFNSFERRKKVRTLADILAE